METAFVEEPLHAAPPQDVLGFEHVRVSVRVTLPQVPDHAPVAQAVHAPLTGQHGELDCVDEPLHAADEPQVITHVRVLVRDPHVALQVPQAPQAELALIVVED